MLHTFLTEIFPSTVIFIVVWMIFGNAVVKPFLKNLEDREERTTGDEKRAGEARQKTKQLLAQVEQELKVARLEGIRLRDDQVLKAKSEANKIADQASSASMAQLEAARDDIAQMKAKVRSELGSEVEGLSAMLIEKLMSAPGERVIH